MVVADLNRASFCLNRFGWSNWGGDKTWTTEYPRMLPFVRQHPGLN
jgi:hypothetical protein